MGRFQRCPNHTMRGMHWGEKVKRKNIRWAWLDANGNIVAGCKQCKEQRTDEPVYLRTCHGRDDNYYWIWKWSVNKKIRWTHDYDKELMLIDIPKSNELALNKPPTDTGGRVIWKECGSAQYYHSSVRNPPSDADADKFAATHSDYNGKYFARIKVNYRLKPPRSNNFEVEFMCKHCVQRCEENNINEQLPDFELKG